MVICAICHREFKRITRTHLVQHGVTTEEYKQLFPESPIITEELRNSYGKFFRENNPMKSPEMREYFSELFTRRIVSEETRDKISKSNLGRKHGPMSNERKQKIGESNRKTRKQKIEAGWQPLPYKMSDAARKRASKRMQGNTLGKGKSHNKGKTLDLSDDQRNNRSRKRVEYLSGNKTIKSGTKPEKQFIEFLTNQNIKFEHQFPMYTDNGSWLYDFYLPTLNLFVEIDGEFWHSTKQSICRDEIKNNIAKKNGITVARITTNNLDFSIIFLDPDTIWTSNYKIINDRKKRNELL
jgi:very-short-patch-repair endonuclease